MLGLTKITLLLLSLSIRSANIPDVPFDFELMSGIENKYSKSVLLYERENGKYYYGCDVEYGFKFVKFTNYKKTAKKIDIQKLSLLYPIKGFSFGLSYSAKRWKEPIPLLTLIWENEYSSIEYSVGNKRKSLEAGLNYEIKVSEKISIVPLLLFKKFDENVFYQTKLTFEVKV